MPHSPEQPRQPTPEGGPAQNHERPAELRPEHISTARENITARGREELARLEDRATSTLEGLSAAEGTPGVLPQERGVLRDISLAGQAAEARLERAVTPPRPVVERSQPTRVETPRPLGRAGRRTAIAAGLLAFVAMVNEKTNNHVSPAPVEDVATESAPQPEATDGMDEARKRAEQAIALLNALASAEGPGDEAAARTETPVDFLAIDLDVGSLDDFSATERFASDLDALGAPDSHEYFRQKPIQSRLEALGPEAFAEYSRLTNGLKVEQDVDSLYVYSEAGDFAFDAIYLAVPDEYATGIGTQIQRFSEEGAGESVHQGSLGTGEVASEEIITDAIQRNVEDAVVDYLEEKYTTPSTAEDEPEELADTTGTEEVDLEEQDTGTGADVEVVDEEQTADTGAEWDTGDR